MATHLRPALLLFVPYTDRALFCGSPYVNDLAQTASRYNVLNPDGSDAVAPADNSGTDTSFTVTGITLVAGTIYTARIKYKNSDGYSDYSEVYTAAVADADFSRPAAPSLVLPGQAAGFPPTGLSLAPTYRTELRHGRDIVEQRTQGGHFLRRLVNETGARAVRFDWHGLTAAQRTTLRNVLEASLGSYDTGHVVGFDFSAVTPATPPPLVGRAWLPLDGTIRVAETAPGIYNVTVEALEITP